MVHPDIDYLRDKRPISRFGMPLGDDSECMFAFRWPADAFRSLKDFGLFCDKFAHLFPLLMIEFDERELDALLIEDDLNDLSRQVVSKSDPVELIEQSFGLNPIPWLGFGHYSKVVDLSDGGELNIRALGEYGFFVAAIEDDIGGYIEDKQISFDDELPLKVTDTSIPKGLPLEDPNIFSLVINDRTVEESDDDFQRALLRIHQRVAEHIGEPTIVQYSAYELDDHGLPIDNLSDVAILDYAVVLADADESYGVESRAFESQWMDEPTWLDLCLVLHEQMKYTRNFQHIYLEGVEKQRGASMHKPQASLFRLILGS